jgi:hypothetical protein
MSISYLKIQKKPQIFLRLFGVSVEQFEMILSKVSPEWQSKVVSAYKRPGRPYDLQLEDMVLMLLLYYRSYITQEFVGYLFDLHKSGVCRIIQKLEPILAKVMAISKARKLSKEEVEQLLIDATEQPIERPKRGQKPYYSGKKKRHTMKTQITITRKGRIIDVSKPTPGSVHDFTVFKQGEPLPPDSAAFVDSGFQGIDKLHPASEFPYKATKDKPLVKEEKEYNHALSRIRVKVENVLGQIKVFRILSDRYRNKRKRYGIKFNIIAGIVNLKNGFANA